MDIDINNLKNNILYSPIIKKNIKSNYKYYSKYHLETIINNNINNLEEILKKRINNKINQIDINNTNNHIYIKSEIAMNYKEKTLYCLIKDQKKKDDYLKNHIINNMKNQNGELEPRIFIFSISIDQENQYNLLNNENQREYIKQIIISQIIQQMKFHLIVRKYYQSIIH